MSKIKLKERWKLVALYVVPKNKTVHVDGQEAHRPAYTYAFQISDNITKRHTPEHIFNHLPFV